MINDDHAKAVVKLKKLAAKRRSMDARLYKWLEPHTISFSTMVERIEQAYNAADQLPTDLESLSEARQKIADLAKDAIRDQGDVCRIREAANELDNLAMLIAVFL